MNVLPTRLAGLVLIDPRVHGDQRGFFVETYEAERYRAIGITAKFVQDNHSRSGRGALRGLHFQTEPGQAKLVRCARGVIRDVVVDLRRSSPTFGQSESFDLDDVTHRQVFVPVGFAHGFVVRSEVADVTYKVSSSYDATTERGLAWDDPQLAIAWGIERPILSDRDRSNPTLADLSPTLPDW